MYTTPVYINSRSLRKTERSFLRRMFDDGAKRLFDMTASFFGLVILSPVFLLIAILIKRDSDGPVFYWGPRMGKGGQPFHILKFRTMYETPQSYAGPAVTAKGDDRITPLGHWLRDTKLNELPQLWNVFIGEMSLVGPRPEDTKIASDWSDESKKEILSVRPGITSPASVLYHDEETLLSGDNPIEDYLEDIMPDKMRLDHLYVRNHSFWADIDTIFWTFSVLLPRLMSTGIPEGSFFSGPFARMFNRNILWFFVDCFLALGATVTAVAIAQYADVRSILGELIWLSLVVSWFFNVLNFFLGFNQIYWSKAYIEDGMGLVLTAMASVSFALLLEPVRSYFYAGLPTLLIALAGLMSMMGFISFRYRSRVVNGISGLWMRIRHKSLVSAERVLIVGFGEGSEVANWLLRRSIFAPAFDIVGVVSDYALDAQGMRLGGNTILGGMGDLSKLIERYEIDVVVLAILNYTEADKKRVDMICQKHQVRLLLLSTLLNRLNHQMTRPLQRKASDTNKFD